MYSIVDARQTPPMSQFVGNKLNALEDLHQKVQIFIQGRKKKVRIFPIVQVEVTSTTAKWSVTSKRSCSTFLKLIIEVSSCSTITLLFDLTGNIVKSTTAVLDGLSRSEVLVLQIVELVLPYQVPVLQVHSC